MTGKRIFKYFGDKKHLDSFVNQGEVMFNPLSYFLSCEDWTRRDELENSNLYKPANGLQITKVQTQEQFTDPRALLSMIKNPHRVFVFCTSTEFSEHLYQKFGSAGCVEIFDLEEFKKRISLKIRNPAHNIKNKKLLADKVDYYNPELESGSRHACPDQIVMSKVVRFSEEREFRFAFTKDSNAFDVNNVDYFLTNNVPPANVLSKGKKLILGDLSGIVKIVR